jgi:hypothetical protein
MGKMTNPNAIRPMPTFKSNAIIASPNATQKVALIELICILTNMLKNSRKNADLPKSVDL